MHARVNGQVNLGHDDVTVRSHDFHLLQLNPRLTVLTHASWTNRQEKMSSGKPRILAFFFRDSTPGLLVGIPGPENYQLVPKITNILAQTLRSSNTVNKSRFF